jgi:hypothetical protein
VLAGIVWAARQGGSTDRTHAIGEKWHCGEEYSPQKQNMCVGIGNFPKLHDSRFPMINTAGSDTLSLQ